MLNIAWIIVVILQGGKGEVFHEFNTKGGNRTIRETTHKKKERKVVSTSRQRLLATYSILKRVTT